jgi:hypothetical protein
MSNGPVCVARRRAFGLPTEGPGDLPGCRSGLVERSSPGGFSGTGAAAGLARGLLSGESVVAGGRLFTARTGGILLGRRRIRVDGRKLVTFAGFLFG